MNHPTTLSETRPPRRWPFVVLLLASFAWLGLVAGTAVGARWFVPAGSGLAGLVVGGVLGWKAAHGLLRAAAAVVTVLALLTAGLLVWRFVAAQAERRQNAGMDVPLPPPAGFRIESRIAESDEKRRYRELTIDGDAWRATWHGRGPDSRPADS